MEWVTGMCIFCPLRASNWHVIKPGMETEMKRNETAHALLVSSNYVISELRDGRGEILCY